MHHDELWQNFKHNGLPNGSYPSKLGNPPVDSDDVVGACCVWLYRYGKNGIEVLFQKRSKVVDYNAEKWDVSAGGHLNYGEDIVTGVLREAREEIGAKLDPEKLEYVFSLRSVQGKNMLCNYFLYDWTGRADDFHFDDQEVSEVKWVPLQDFGVFIDKNAKDALKNAKHTLALTKTFLERHGDQ